MSLAIAVPGLVLLAQVLVPEESEHKRDLWLACLRHRERRAVDRPPTRRNDTGGRSRR